jgi:hypothetical protein
MEGASALHPADSSRSFAASVRSQWRGNTDCWNFDSGGNTSVETPAWGSRSPLPRRPLIQRKPMMPAQSRESEAVIKSMARSVREVLPERALRET